LNVTGQSGCWRVPAGTASCQSLPLGTCSTRSALHG
jgi:hypothetical protein